MLGNILSTGEQVLILVVLLAVGFLCGKIRIFNDQSISHLSAFALKIVGPCAIVESFCRQFDSAMLRAMGIVALLAFAAHALYAAFAYVCIRGGKEPTRRVLRYGTVFANCGYMGLPLQQVLFGADGVFYGATWIGVYNLVAWSFGLVLMSGDRRQISFKKLLLNPGILAVLTGIVIFVCSIELPTIILQPIHYFSALNVPVPMVISGYYLSKADLRTIWKHANYYITIALRLAVIPLCGIGLMFLLQKAFRLDGMLLAACIVDIAAPVAAATTMFSTLFRQDSETAANLVSISTLLSVLTLPIMVALAQSVFYNPLSVNPRRRMTEPFRRSIASESEKQYNLYEIYRLIKKEKEKFIMDYAKESLKLHEQWKGKIEVVATVPVSTKDDLSLAYTPGVAQPCLEIQKDINKSYELTRRHNLCAVITDGTAVLGLGDIGPEAGMPVMEGKCVLFKAFGGVDAFPLCVKTKNVDEFVETVYNISGSFGGINLEDISAPRCFEIERKLKEKCDIPIFHDDQHGTAVITLAGLTNALKVVGKKKEDVKVVTSGAGAAAISIVKLLLSAGYKNITMCDRKGAIYAGREGLNWIKEEMAQVTNLEKKAGPLSEQLKGADVFIGVSAPGMVTKEMVQTMNEKAIIFACANPTPEIFPDEAKAGGAAVVSTGRSDYPNQINNVLAFPGIFRGTFDVRASDINEEMKMAAAKALADLISDEELSADYIIPKAFDPRVGKAVAAAVAEAAKASGVARI